MNSCLSKELISYYLFPLVGHLYLSDTQVGFSKPTGGGGVEGALGAGGVSCHISGRSKFQICL